MRSRNWRFASMLIALVFALASVLAIQAQCGFELGAREDLYQTVHLLRDAIDGRVGVEASILESYVVGERLVLALDQLVLLPA